MKQKPPGFFAVGEVMLLVVFTCLVLSAGLSNAQEPTEMPLDLIDNTTTGATASTSGSQATVSAYDIPGSESTVATPSAGPTTPAEKQPEPPKPQAKGLGLLELFKNGGPVMWPLLLLVVVAIIFSIERGIALGLARRNARKFMDEVDSLLDKEDVEAAKNLCDETKGPVAYVIKAGLLRWGKGPRQIEKAVETAGAGAMSKHERGLPILASIANIAPLLGFLGTVTGMIKSFGVIAQAGLSNPGAVAKGISEALITTASGLIIAIPTLAAYNFFTSMITKFALEMDESSSQLMDRSK